MKSPLADRHEAILALLVAGEPDSDLMERACGLTTELLGVSGAGLCLVVGRGHEIRVHGTDPVAEELENLQVTLGQGPCVEAVRIGAPVLVPELETFRSADWARYAERALALGVRAVFTFPLQSDDLQLGALDLYRVTPGMLDASQLADAAMLASILARTLIAQRDRIDLDLTVSALHRMTATLREPGTPLPEPLAGLGVTVGQAAQLPPPDSPAGDSPAGDARPADINTTIDGGRHGVP